MRASNINRTVLVAFMLIVFFTGFNAIAVKSSETQLPPFFSAGIRFGLAAIILLALMLIFRLPIPRGRGLLGAILFGILGSGISRALLYYALEELPAGVSMVLLALVPLLTFLFACMHKQETFMWRCLTGSFLAVGGIGMILKDQLHTQLPILPVIAVIGAAACFAEALVIIKIFPQSHPITTNAIALTTGSILLFIFSALLKESPTMSNLTSSWESLLYLILFGTVATFILTIYVVKNLTASASSYQFVLFPIITVIMGALINNETVSISLLSGSAMVLTGVYIGGIAKTNRIKLFYSHLLSRVKVPSAER